MKRRILLVDDDLTVLLTLKAVLESSGFEVETAASVPDALRQMKQHAYHLVITDMKMEQDESGYEVVHAAQQQPYQPATAVLTAFPDLGGSWRHAGAHTMLVKPVNARDLLRQIEVLLIRHEDEKHRPHKAAEEPGRPGASRRIS
ncbi:MAG TPA: response regulator [Terriglobales bacterium]|nr:response regulator [Terriglobales bacterium]